MARALLFTHTELNQIVRLAKETVYERCKSDEASLRSFLRQGLRLSPLESEPVYDRCQGDAAYLQSLVADHVNRFDERGLLALLVGWGGTEIAHQLGFDPFDPRREEAFRRAQRILNPRQRMVLAVAFVVCLMLGLFPPWLEQTWEERRTHLVFPTTHTKLVAQEFHGYGFLFSPRPDSPRTIVSVSPPSPYSTTYQYTSYRLDYVRLLGQWSLIALAATVPVVLLRHKKWSAERYVASLRPTMPGGLHDA